MGQPTIINLFFEHPANDFQIRGIAKSLKIPKTTVSYHINNFLKEKLIIKRKKGVFPSFAANETSEIYRFRKREDSIRKIMVCGLLDYIEKEANPRCIVLFGSFAKAEYDVKSDMDIFVQARDCSLDVGKFEKKLKHKINIFFEADLGKLSPELFNNIVNGIKLRGFLKIK